MRVWTRCRVATLCGACGEMVHKGDALQVIPFPQTARRLKRCTMCADARAPDNLADLPDVYEPPTLRPFADVEADRLDALAARGQVRAEREWYR